MCCCFVKKWVTYLFSFLASITVGWCRMHCVFLCCMSVSVYVLVFADDVVSLLSNFSCSHVGRGCRIGPLSLGFGVSLSKHVPSVALPLLYSYFLWLFVARRRDRDRDDDDYERRRRRRDDDDDSRDRRGITSTIICLLEYHRITESYRCAGITCLASLYIDLSVRAPDLKKKWCGNAE